MEPQSDFDFYLKFAKPLILNLPKLNDRVLASAWVVKLLQDNDASEKVKLDYIKLLLFVLQRKTLAPPFDKHPNNTEKIEEFPENRTLVDVAREIIEKESELKRENNKKRILGQVGDFPPYISEFSADLLEYAAVQTIENFGVHGYYAISKQPLSQWYRVDKQALPKAAKSMIEVTTGPPTITATSSTPEILKAKAPSRIEEAPAEAPPAEETAESEAEAKPKKKKKLKKSTYGGSPPADPIGKILPPEDRSPPTWGSNLLEVKRVLDENVPAASDTEVLWTSGAATPVEGWTSAASLPYLTPPLPQKSAPAKKKVPAWKKPPPKNLRSKLKITRRGQEEPEAEPQIECPKKPKGKKGKKGGKGKKGVTSSTSATSEAPSTSDASKKPTTEGTTEEEPETKKAEIDEDMAQIMKETGLTEADLVDINLADLDLDLDHMEELPEVDYKPSEEILQHEAKLGEMDDQMNAFIKQLEQLEAENAEDLAQYGHLEAYDLDAGSPEAVCPQVGSPRGSPSRRSPHRIPQEHDSPFKPDENIHMSPEAREIILEAVAASPEVQKALEKSAKGKKGVCPKKSGSKIKTPGGKPCPLKGQPGRGGPGGKPCPPKAAAGKPCPPKAAAGKPCPAKGAASKTSVKDSKTSVKSSRTSVRSSKSSVGAKEGASATSVTKFFKVPRCAYAKKQEPKRPQETASTTSLPQKKMKGPPRCAMVKKYPPGQGPPPAAKGSQPRIAKGVRGRPCPPQPCPPQPSPPQPEPVYVTPPPPPPPRRRLQPQEGYVSPSGMHSFTQRPLTPPPRPCRMPSPPRPPSPPPPAPAPAPAKTCPVKKKSSGKIALQKQPSLAEQKKSLQELRAKAMSYGKLPKKKRAPREPPKVSSKLAASVSRLAVAKKKKSPEKIKIKVFRATKMPSKTKTKKAPPQQQQPPPQVEKTPPPQPKKEPLYDESPDPEPRSPMCDYKRLFGQRGRRERTPPPMPTTGRRSRFARSPECPIVAYVQEQYGTPTQIRHDDISPIKPLTDMWRTDILQSAKRQVHSFLPTSTPAPPPAHCRNLMDEFPEADATQFITCETPPSATFHHSVSSGSPTPPRPPTPESPSIDLEQFRQNIGQKAARMIERRREVPHYGAGQFRHSRIPEHAESDSPQRPEHDMTCLLPATDQDNVFLEETPPDAGFLDDIKFDTPPSPRSPHLEGDRYGIDMFLDVFDPACENLDASAAPELVEAFPSPESEYRQFLEEMDRDRIDPRQRPMSKSRQRARAPGLAAICETIDYSPEGMDVVQGAMAGRSTKQEKFGPRRRIPGSPRHQGRPVTKMGPLGEVPVEIEEAEVYTGPLMPCPETPSPMSMVASMNEMRRRVAEAQGMHRRPPQRKHKCPPKMPPVKEKKVAERSYEVRYEVKADVEREFAQAEAEARRQHTLLDEPIDNRGLSPPLRPIHPDDFVTPPHLKRPLPKSHMPILGEQPRWARTEQTKEHIDEIARIQKAMLAANLEELSPGSRAEQMRKIRKEEEFRTEYMRKARKGREHLYQSQVCPEDVELDEFERLEKAISVEDDLDEFEQLERAVASEDQQVCPIVEEPQYEDTCPIREDPFEQLVQRELPEGEDYIDRDYKDFQGDWLMDEQVCPFDGELSTSMFSPPREFYECEPWHEGGRELYELGKSARKALAEFHQARPKTHEERYAMEMEERERRKCELRQQQEEAARLSMERQQQIKQQAEMERYYYQQRLKRPHEPSPPPSPLMGSPRTPPVQRPPSPFLSPGHQRSPHTPPCPRPGSRPPSPFMSPRSPQTPPQYGPHSKPSPYMTPVPSYTPQGAPPSPEFEYDEGELAELGLNAEDLRGVKLNDSCFNEELEAVDVSLDDEENQEIAAKVEEQFGDYQKMLDDMLAECETDLAQFEENVDEGEEEYDFECE